MRTVFPRQRGGKSGGDGLCLMHTNLYSRDDGGVFIGVSEPEAQNLSKRNAQLFV